LVANAVTAESEAVLVQWYSSLGGELRRYQHYVGEPLGKFTGWRPAVRGQRRLQRCPVCLYAGSIMPDDLLALCPDDARVVDSGPLTLDQIVDELAAADAARPHLA